MVQIRAVKRMLKPVESDYTRASNCCWIYNSRPAILLAIQGEVGIEYQAAVFHGLAVSKAQNGLEMSAEGDVLRENG